MKEGRGRVGGILICICFYFGFFCFFLLSSAHLARKQCPQARGPLRCLATLGPNRPYRHPASKTPDLAAFLSCSAQSGSKFCQASATHEETVCGLFQPFLAWSWWSCSSRNISAAPTSIPLPEVVRYCDLSTNFSGIYFNAPCSWRSSL